MGKYDSYTDAELTAIKLDSIRVAVAMAIAAGRGDADGIAVIWHGAADKGAVVHELAGLPVQLARGMAARYGDELDIEQALSDLLLTLPAQIDSDPEEDR